MFEGCMHKPRRHLRVAKEREGDRLRLALGTQPGRQDLRHAMNDAHVGAPRGARLGRQRNGATFFRTKAPRAHRGPRHHQGRRYCHQATTRDIGNRLGCSACNTQTGECPGTATHRNGGQVRRRNVVVPAKLINGCHEMIVGIIGDWNLHLKDSALCARTQCNASRALRDFDRKN